MKGQFEKGYRDGVILIKTNKEAFCENFICPIVKIDEKTKLISKVTKRRSEEENYIQTKALNGIKLKTISVEMVLYRKDVLEETKENSTNKDWELIAFHAIPEGIENLPMKPATMMRN